MGDIKCPYCDDYGAKRNVKIVHRDMHNLTLLLMCEQCESNFTVEYKREYIHEEG